MSSLFKIFDLKEVSETTIFLINGFVHKIENSMSNANDFMIPEAIIMIIISFYHIVEYFAEYSPKYVDISNDGKIAAKVVPPQHNDADDDDEYYQDRSIYGVVVIPNKTRRTFKWIIKSITYGLAEDWAIGIASASNHLCDNVFYWKQSKSHAYEASGHKYDQCCARRLISGWNEGDCITLTYEGVSRILSISVNGDYHETSKMKVIDNPGGFKMAVYLGYVRGGAEILEFKEYCA